MDQIFARYIERSTELWREYLENSFVNEDKQDLGVVTAIICLPSSSVTLVFSLVMLILSYQQKSLAALIWGILFIIVGLFGLLISYVGWFHWDKIPDPKPRAT